MTEARRWKLAIWIPAVLCLIGMAGTAALCARAFETNGFERLCAVCDAIVEEHPEAEAWVLSALKKSASEQAARGRSLPVQYGYRAESFRRVRGRDALPAAMLALAVLGSHFASARYLRRRLRRRIAALTEYLARANTSAGGTLVPAKEDEFSRLQDEMEKTVTFLLKTKEDALTAKNRFAEHLTNIAHQLKTPITSALLSLELSRQTADDAARQVRAQLERLNRLEEALLNIARIDAGTLRLKRARVDAYTALNLAADQLADLMRRKGIAVQIPENGCVEFEGDLEWAMEALINLMKNCMEHSPRGGTVHCDYSGNPLYAQMRIWDEGEGFPAEDLPRLFERFYRGQNAAKDGMGIGLSMARDVFERMNGVVSAKNLREGGACFEIRIYRH